MAFSPRKQNSQFTTHLMGSHQQLWDTTSQWRTTGESLRRLILPNHAEVDTRTLQEGQEKGEHVFSSTATIAAPRLASHLSGNVTPSKLQWFDFEAPTEDMELLDDEDLNWLQDEPRKIFKGLQSSNFGVESLKDWLSLIVYGTSAIYSDEHPIVKGGFIFHTVPYGSYAIDEWHDGTISRFDRRFKWNLSKIASKWGLPNLHPSMQADVKNNPFQSREIVQIVRRVEKDDLELPGNFTFISYYVDQPNNHIIEISGYTEMPFHVSRWFQAAGESLGRGPGHDGLADIRSDNEVARLSLNSLALNVLPPMIGKHEGVLTQPILRPASMTWVAEQGDLQPWQTGSRLDITQYGQDRLQRSIEKAFFQDLINVTSQQPQGRTPISATQINANIDVMLPIIGPFLANKEHEQQIPMLNRLFRIRQRQGMVEPPPPGLAQLLQSSAGALNVLIKGPISKAIQKISLDSMDAMITRVNSITPIWPVAADHINIPRTIQAWSVGENAPREMLNTQEEVQQIQDDRQAAQQQAQDSQDLMDASQITKNTQGVTNAGPQ